MKKIVTGCKPFESKASDICSGIHKFSDVIIDSAFKVNTTVASQSIRLIANEKDALRRGWDKTKRRLRRESGADADDDDDADAYEPGGSDEGAIVPYCDNKTPTTSLSTSKSQQSITSTDIVHPHLREKTPDVEHISTSSSLFLK